MATIRLNHFYTGSKLPPDQIMEKYKELGFICSSKFALHKPGIISSFVFLGLTTDYDYFEFLSIRDPKEYHSDLKISKMWPIEKPHIFGLVANTNNADQLYLEMQAQGIKDVYRIDAKADQETAADPVRWKFIEYKKDENFFSLSIIEYCLKTKYFDTNQDILMGPNRIYAFGGVIVDETNPEQVYHKLLESSLPNWLSLDDGILWYDYHELVPMDFKIFQNKIKNLTGICIDKRLDISLFAGILYSDNMNLTKKFFQNSFKPIYEDEMGLWLLPSEYDGLLVLIREVPVETWKKRRLDPRWNTQK